jgi:hypothetical protein
MLGHGCAYRDPRYSRSGRRVIQQRCQLDDIRTDSTCVRRETPSTKGGQQIGGITQRALQVDVRTRPKRRTRTHGSHSQPEEDLALRHQPFWSRQLTLFRSVDHRAPDLLQHVPA